MLTLFLGRLGTIRPALGAKPGASPDWNWNLVDLKPEGVLDASHTASAPHMIQRAGSHAHCFVVLHHLTPFHFFQQSEAHNNYSDWSNRLSNPLSPNRATIQDIMLPVTIRVSARGAFHLNTELESV
jgi:hypothetical protein